MQHTRAENYIEPDREEHYDAAGNMDEKIEISYMHDAYGNWISRSILVWDAASNQMIEVERDSRKIDYY